MSSGIPWADMALLWLPAGRGLGRAALLVLVVVVTVGGVTVPVVRVIDMVAVGDRLMPAARPVSMPVAGVGQVGQRMLVVMALVRRVGVTFVDVVGVTLALGAGMPAAGPVDVLVVCMDRVLGGHGSSLLCWTASATM
jgi:hypothetical protein